MTKQEELEHRLAMVLDDLNAIRGFIHNKCLTDIFREPTKYADECFTHFNNIEIACDLTDDESLTWKPFKER